MRPSLDRSVRLTIIWGITGYGVCWAPWKVTLCHVAMTTHRASKNWECGNAACMSRDARANIPDSAHTSNNY